MIILFRVQVCNSLTFRVVELRCRRAVNLKIFRVPVEVHIWSRACILEGHLTNLKSTRYLGLEYPLRVVLFRDAANILHILVTVASQRALTAIGVVEVNVLIVSSNRFGVGIEFPKCGSGQSVEQVIIGFVLPGVVKKYLCTQVSGERNGLSQWETALTEEIFVESFEAEYIPTALLAVLGE